MQQDGGEPAAGRQRVAVGDDHDGRYAGWAGAAEQDRVSGAQPDAAFDERELEDVDGGVFSPKLRNQFEEQAKRLEERARARRKAVQLKSAVLDNEGRETSSAEDMLGRRQPQDEYQGDVNIRTLRALLKMIDDRGFERCAAGEGGRSMLSRHCLLLTTFVSVRRSPHQLKFHSAFERATARVIYREVRLPSLPLLNPYNTLTAVLCSQDWGTQRPNIMRKNNWDTCPSEVLIRCAYFYYRHFHCHSYSCVFPLCVSQHAAPLRQDIFVSHALLRTP